MGAGIISDQLFFSVLSVVLAKLLTHVSTPGALTTSLHSYVLGALCLKRRWNPVPEPTKSMTSAIASLELQAGVDPSKVLPSHKRWLHSIQASFSFPSFDILAPCCHGFPRFLCSVSHCLQPLRCTWISFPHFLLHQVRVQVSAVGGVLRFQGQTTKPVKPVKKSALSKTTRRKHVRTAGKAPVSKTTTSKVPVSKTTTNKVSNGKINVNSTVAPTNVHSTKAHTTNGAPSDMRPVSNATSSSTETTISRQSPQDGEGTSRQLVGNASVTDDDDDDDIVELLDGIPNSDGDEGTTVQGNAGAMIPQTGQTPEVIPTKDVQPGELDDQPEIRDSAATDVGKHAAEVDAVAHLVMDVQGLFDDDDDDDADEGDSPAVADAAHATNGIPVSTTLTTHADSKHRGTGVGAAVQDPVAFASHPGTSDAAVTVVPPWVTIDPPRVAAVSTRAPTGNAAAAPQLPNTPGDLDFYIAGLLDDDDDDAESVVEDRKDTGNTDMSGLIDDGSHYRLDATLNTAGSTKSTTRDLVPDTEVPSVRGAVAAASGRWGTSDDESPAITKARARTKARVICYESEDDDHAVPRHAPPQQRTATVVLETPKAAFDDTADPMPQPVLDDVMGDDDMVQEDEDVCRTAAAGTAIDAEASAATRTVVATAVAVTAGLTSAINPAEHNGTDERAAAQARRDSSADDDSEEEDAEDSPVFVKRGARGAASRHRVLATQCSPPRNPPPSTARDSPQQGKRKRTQRASVSDADSLVDDGSDENDFCDFKRPTSTRRPKSKARREMEHRELRRVQQVRDRLYHKGEGLF